MHARRINRRSTALGLFAAGIAASPLRMFAQGTPEATPSGETRFVTDYLEREIEIPARPQRVITLSLPILEIALAVGIKPVGSASYGTMDGFPDYLADQADGIELVGDSEWDFEKIITLEPDLAIVDYFGDKDAEALALLEKIVPVVTVGMFRDNWRQDSADVAFALNRSEEFKAVEERYDARVAVLKEELAPEWARKTIALLRFRAEDIRFLKSNSFAGTIVSDVDLHFPEIETDNDGIAQVISMEQAQVLDVDALFIVHDSGAEAEAAYTDAIANPVFQLLDVVQRGNVYLVDQETWIALRGYGATEVIFNDLERYLVNGEPGLQVG